MGRLEGVLCADEDAAGEVGTGENGTAWMAGKRWRDITGDKLTTAKAPAVRTTSTMRIQAPEGRGFISNVQGVPKE
jgi:hypothetical protein